MPILISLTCARDGHDNCTNGQCQCECHKDPETRREQARKSRVEAREVAHHTVKVFDHNPDLVNTQAAILALQQYETTLKEARHGR